MEKYLKSVSQTPEYNKLVIFVRNSGDMIIDRAGPISFSMNKAFLKGWCYVDEIIDEVSKWEDLYKENVKLKGELDAIKNN